MTPSLPRGQSALKVRAPGVILRDLQNHGAPGETRTWHTLAHASRRYSPSPPCSRLGPPCGDDTPSPTERTADGEETGRQQTPSPVLLRLPSKRGVGGGDGGSPRREWRAGVRPLGGGGGERAPRAQVRVMGCGQRGQRTGLAWLRSRGSGEGSRAGPMWLC